MRQSAEVGAWKGRASDPYSGHTSGYVHSFSENIANLNYAASFRSSEGEAAVLKDSVQFKAVMLGQLGPLGIVMTQEVDCYMPPPPPQQQQQPLPLMGGSINAEDGSGMAAASPLLAHTNMESWMEVKSSR